MNENMLIAIIAAGSALLGSAIGQLGSVLMHWLERRQRRGELLRDKYEQLATYTSDLIDWARRAQQCTSLQEISSLSQPLPARHALTLTLIYFPNLKQQAIGLLNAAVEFQQAIAHAYTEQIPASAGAQAVVNNKDAYMRASDQLRSARQAMDVALQKYAGTYAGH